MRIGILTGDYSRLKNWELRIIEGIKNDPALELALIVKDGREPEESTRISRLIKAKRPLGKILFTLQILLEERFFKEQATVDKEAILNYLQTIPTLSLKPERKGFLDVFSKEDSARIKDYKLDILLRHGFNILRGSVLDAAEFGIWGFHHDDNALIRGGPPGFWEIILGHPVTGVTLQQLTTQLDGGLIIDKGYYNTRWNYVLNNRIITEGSVSMLFKNIRKLQQNDYAPEPSPEYAYPLYKLPSLGVALKYVFHFYKKAAKTALQGLIGKLFGTRYHCWTFFPGKGNFMEATLSGLKPLKPPKNHFWADPFLFEYEGNHYVFFENYSYQSNKAKISCARIENNKLAEVKDVLKKDYHLSYPFIFEEDGSIFMLPETSANSRMEIYRCLKFPDQWEIYSTAFEGELIADASYFRDDAGQRWLFVNRGFGGEVSTELHIYRIDSLKMAKMEAHRQNPVLIDSRRARNAGPAFSLNGEYFRPSQNNSHGVYGYGLNVNRIVSLSIDKYEEEPVYCLEPDFKKGLRGTHHLHQMKDIFVIDAAYKRAGLIK